MKIRENIPLSNLTTMRLGGKARYVIEVENEREVAEAYEFANRGGNVAGKNMSLPVFVLGRGANSIGRDEGFDGVIILDKIKGMEFIEEKTGETLVKAAGGEEWDKVVEQACKRGLTGIEALSAIPGTVGAAPVQNIGAYGQEVSTVIEGVRAYDTSGKKVVELRPEEMQFGYRRSIFNREEAGRYFIISVMLRLKKGRMTQPLYNSLEKYAEEHNIEDFSPEGIRQMVRAVRAAKLPDPEIEASAGSFFKNVYLNDDEAREAEGRGVKVWKSSGVASAGQKNSNKDAGKKTNKVNAGWLIEAAGLKGALLHGMRVSEKAALILINESAHSYADLAAAREEIRGRIQEAYGYELEQEPVEIVA